MYVAIDLEQQRTMQFEIRDLNQVENILTLMAKIEQQPTYSRLIFSGVRFQIYIKLHEIWTHLNTHKEGLGCEI